MIEIKSRKEALATFGPIGLKAWDWFVASGYHVFHMPAFGAELVLPKKLEPLTDMELVDAYDACPSGDFFVELRAVVIAHDKRLAEIEENK